MQTCLEKGGIEKRQESLARTEYNSENQYNAGHKNALADGDEKGKGTGHPGGLKNSRPDCTQATGQFDYSNFDTDIKSDAGGKTDRAKRNENLVRSLYNSEKVYSAANIDTSANLREGQYKVR